MARDLTVLERRVTPFAKSTSVMMGPAFAGATMHHDDVLRSNFR